VDATWCRDTVNEWGEDVIAPIMYGAAAVTSNPELAITDVTRLIEESEYVISCTTLSQTLKGLQGEKT
jgi:hypothetical protein